MCSHLQSGVTVSDRKPRVVNKVDSGILLIYFSVGWFRFSRMQTSKTTARHESILLGRDVSVKGDGRKPEKDWRTQGKSHLGKERRDGWVEVLQTSGQAKACMPQLLSVIGKGAISHHNTESGPMKAPMKTNVMDFKAQWLGPLVTCLYFSSQFQIIAHHCRAVTVAGAWGGKSYCIVILKCVTLLWQHYNYLNKQKPRT